MMTVSFDDERRYEECPQRMVFHATFGERTLRCLISRATLEEYFTILGVPRTAPNGCLDIFDRHRARIRASARRVIEELGEADLATVSEVVLSPSLL